FDSQVSAVWEPLPKAPAPITMEPLPSVVANTDDRPPADFFSEVSAPSGITPPNGEDLGDFLGALRAAMKDDTPLGDLTRDLDEDTSFEDSYRPVPQIVPRFRWPRRDKAGSEPFRRRRR
ncbi:MAG: hypothetical protein ACRDYC_10790, partial [Acidimicrobiales bacterium]